MEFRWVAFITLWTMLVGPIMGMPIAAPKASPTNVSPRAAAKASLER
jgi:hypothetical protein